MRVEGPKPAADPHRRPAGLREPAGDVSPGVTVDRNTGDRLVSGRQRRDQSGKLVGQPQGLRPPGTVEGSLAADRGQRQAWPVSTDPGGRFSWSWAGACWLRTEPGGGSAAVVVEPGKVSLVKSGNHLARRHDGRLTPTANTAGWPRPATTPTFVSTFVGLPAYSDHTMPAWHLRGPPTSIVGGRWWTHTGSARQAQSPSPLTTSRAGSGGHGDVCCAVRSLSSSPGFRHFNVSRGLPFNSTATLSSSA